MYKPGSLRIDAPVPDVRLGNVDPAQRQSDNDLPLGGDGNDLGSRGNLELGLPALDFRDLGVPIEAW